MKPLRIKPAYAENFEHEVEKYIKYLDGLSNSATQSPLSQISTLESFAKGAGSIINLLPPQTLRLPYPKKTMNPLYSRKDLSPEQKDAIAIAADGRIALRV